MMTWDLVCQKCDKTGSRNNQKHTGKKTKSNHIENIKTIEIIVFIELSPSDIGLAGSLKGIPGYLELPKHLMKSW